MFANCHQLCIRIATLITATIGVSLPNLTNEEARSCLYWRFGYSGTLVFSTVQVVLLLTVYKYESPSFYIFKENKIMAKETLSMMYESTEDIQQVFGEIEDVNKKFHRNFKSFSLYKVYNRAFWVAMLLLMIQQFTGVNSVMFYAPTMFESQGNNTSLLCV